MEKKKLLLTFHLTRIDNRHIEAQDLMVSKMVDKMRTYLMDYHIDNLMVYICRYLEMVDRMRIEPT